jgi:hypothetical protein
MHAARAKSRVGLAVAGVWGTGGLVVVVAAFARGQAIEPRQDERRDGPETVLAPEFARKLAAPELDWPTPEGVAAAAPKDTDYARYDACRWQEIILRAPFAAARFKGGQARDKGREFVAGVSAGGYDSVYHRWETARYRLQFRCAQWLMSVMVEPKSPPARVKLSAREVEERTAEMLAELVNCGAQLAANSTMKLEPADYGYRISFRQSYGQSRALRHSVSDCNRGVGIDWLAALAVRTDGYSFVFDFRKIGARDSAMPVTTTQPGEKTWFKDRKPAAAPGP